MHVYIIYKFRVIIDPAKGPQRIQSNSIHSPNINFLGKPLDFQFLHMSWQIVVYSANYMVSSSFLQRILWYIYVLNATHCNPA